MRDTLRAYFELMKPRIATMVLVTATLGYYVGGDGINNGMILLSLLIGTAMTSFGSAVLNNCLEVETDRKMDRTRNRPLPSGQISPWAALLVGVYLVLGGTLYLIWQVNLLTAFLALLTAFLYVLVYTPMKRWTWWNTAVGAIPGALPPMGGWAAATGQLDAGAWILFAILFVWQQPHFYAIALMFKEDYRKAGFKMLPVVDETGKRTFRQIIGYSLLLIPVSLLPTYFGLTGWIYACGAVALGLMMLAPGFTLARTHSVLDARKVLRASIIYLPLLLVLIVLDTSV
jgi:protoheme IX farnesyltransferase